MALCSLFNCAQEANPVHDTEGVCKIAGGKIIATYHFCDDHMAFLKTAPLPVSFDGLKVEERWVPDILPI